VTADVAFTKFLLSVTESEVLADRRHMEIAIRALAKREAA